ncbi:DUF2063 domain-containing protein [Hoeflea sp.]|uniref:HvfC/BufC N-terminal domain-containing protein n=1 Tax=Hoeflea sp. TaxID=1940281 RepID=UPI0037498D93
MPQSEMKPCGNVPETSQPSFGAALLNPDLPLPPGVIGPRGKAAVRRFAVYRNNVTVSLINALADIFPAVARLVGEDFFRNMARTYMANEPPQSARLFEYGQGLPAFLERFEPVAKLPYLPDVARLERCWLDAYHAADAVPLAPEALAAVPPQDLGSLRFTPHPATRIVDSQFASVSIFSASRSNSPLDQIKPLTPEAGLVTRPTDEVQIRLLPPGAAAFFEALIAGRTLGEAADQTTQQHPGFDLPSALTAMLESGAFIKCQPEGQPTREDAP